MNLTESQMTVLRRVVRRLCNNPQDREDVLHEAIVISLNRAKVSVMRYLVYDAMRVLYGDPRHPKYLKSLTSELERPDWIASVYVTREDLLSRAEDEYNQDLELEWKALSAAERDARRIETSRALGTSLEDHICAH